MRSSSSSSAVRLLKQRLNANPNGARLRHHGSGLSSTPPPVPSSGGSLKNKAAGTRLAPLDPYPPRARSSSRSTDTTAARAGSTAERGGPRPPVSRSASGANGQGRDRGSSSTALVNSTREGGASERSGSPGCPSLADAAGAGRKPQRPPLAPTTAGHAEGHPSVPSKPRTRRISSGGGGGAVPQRQDAKRRASPGAGSPIEPSRASPSSSASPYAAALPTTSAPPTSSSNARTQCRATEDPTTTVAAAAAKKPQQQQPKQQWPVSEHDMDFSFYKDPKNWNSGLRRPPRGAGRGSDGAALVVEKLYYLLHGKALEPAYASHLWAQCHPDPAAAIAEYEEVAQSRRSGYALYNADDAADGKARRRAEEEPRLHPYTYPLTDGYFRCVRCHTPICSPEFFLRRQTRQGGAEQAALHTGMEALDDSGRDDEDAGFAAPHAISRRRASRQQALFPGYACFTHVHARALRAELNLSPGGGPEAAKSNPFLRVNGQSSASGCLDNNNNNREEEELFAKSRAYCARPAASSAPTAFVLCAHCDGCLGAVTLLSGGDAQQTQEVFVANSMCLQYVAEESTRANMGSHLLLDTSPTGPRTSAGQPAATRSITASGGWVSAAPAPPSLPRGCSPVLLSTQRTRRCLVFQEGVAGDGEGDEGLAARVVVMERNVDDEDNVEEEEDGEREDTGGRGTWAVPVSWKGRTPQNDEDSSNDGSLQNMFDDLDNEALYM